MITIATWSHEEARFGRAGFFVETKHGRISVQFGAGNYCDNYDAPMSQIASGAARLQPSTTCEVWGSMFPGDPVARVPVERVMRFCADVLAAETQEHAHALGAALDEENERMTHPIHDIASAVAAEESAWTTSRARLALLQAAAVLSPTLPPDTGAEVLRDAVRHLCGVVCGDLPSTGCRTCDAVLDTLAECHGMSLRGTTAAEVAVSARDWIGDLLVERDEARAVAARARQLLNEARAHDDDEWHRVRALANAALGAGPDGDIVDVGACAYAVIEALSAEVERLRAELDDVIAGHTSAPTVGATDAGPDVPACDVEGDGVGSAQQGCAVPTAPGPATEVAGQGSGADRPSTIAQAQAVDVSTADAMRGPDGEDCR